MAQGNATEGHHAAWWRRPITIWFAVIAAIIILLLGFVMMKRGQSPAIPYGVFLDQLEAGNVVSVTFEGTQLDGRFKHPVKGISFADKAQQDQTAFTSQVPQFGDPALIAELRKQRVAIDVGAPSAWSWTGLLAHVPWPMLFIIGAALVAAFVRLLRGGRPGGSAGKPQHGMMGLVSGLFAKREETAGPAQHDRPT